MRGLILSASLVLSLTLLAFEAHAVLSRAAMVTETSGGAEIDSKPIRTLQVFSEGSKIQVKPGGKLRLVYLQSGSKEAVSGPCLLEIGSTASKLVEGSGKVVEEQGGGARTKLRRSENIRRMGGSLQANAGDGDLTPATPAHSPDQVLAMLQPADLPGAAPDERNVARAVTVDESRLRALNLPLVAFSVDPFKELAWRGGKGPFRVSLSSNGQTPVSERVEGFSWAPPVRYIPGQPYELSVTDEQSKATLTQPFMVLLPSERVDFEANVEEFSAMLGGSERDRLLAQVTIAEDWGLWLDALDYSRAAAEAYPEDAGIRAALGRALYNLGQLREAAQVLREARTLESGANL